MLKIAALGDIHLGNKRNPSTEIIKNLRAAFPDNKETASLDMIVIPGDVYDDLLSLNYSELPEIDFWIRDLLELCAKHKIVLRILEGTPSHDWKQSYRFEFLNKIAKINADVRHIKELYVEHIEKLNITVLYVPDEWNDTAEKTLTQAKSLIKATADTKVDMAVMHGQFAHQLPPVVKAQKHTAEEYRALVYGPIIISHIHTPSEMNGVIAPGSFDRISHNEEHNKGHVVINYDPVTKKYKNKFVTNTGAKVFKTIRCESTSLDDALIEINDALTGLPAQSHIRVMAAVDNPILQNMDALNRMFTQFRWTKQAIGEVENDNEVVEPIDTDYIPITITKENISDLLIDRMRGELEPDQLVMAHKLIREVVDGL